MKVNVFNKAHYNIEIDGIIFPSFKETILEVATVSTFFRKVRAEKSFRIGKNNNDSYVKRHGLYEGKKYNFCLDIQEGGTGEAYRYAIEALAKPIIKFLPEGETAFSNRPLKHYNIRFFNSTRIRQQGKPSVGPKDIFFSHGIGDKNYWVGNKIKDFKYAFVPGPAWEKRMRETGYKGEIFISGYTKLDDAINCEIKKNNYDKPYIVWAPTHGYNYSHKGRSSFPECNELINSLSKDYIKKIALHPTSKMHNRQKHIPTMQELIDADVVIADAGSTLYEAWILGKPVIFPDWICKKDILRHFSKDKNNFEYQIYSKGIGYHAKDIQDMNKMIEKALINGMKDNSKEFIEGIYPKQLRGKAGKTAADYIIKIASR